MLKNVYNNKSILNVVSNKTNDNKKKESNKRLLEDFQWLCY